MKAIFLFSAILSLAIGYASAQDKIEFQAPKLYPEGVAFDEKNSVFYVSSVTEGTIGKVDRSGKYKVFYRDTTMKSSFGMKVDSKRSRLWVCVADPNYSKYSDSSTFKKMSKVIALDLNTGKKVSTVDLSKLVAGKHFANDLTLDPKGNVYVTDSYSPVIYKIDTNDKASVFARNDLFKSAAIGLNGIVFHPKGFLLTVNNGNGTILKVDMKKPDNVELVKCDTFFPGADGLLLDREGKLVLVQNKGVNRVFEIASTDDWKTAKVVKATNVEERFQNPTTSTLVADSIYILNSKMNELSDSTKNPSRKFSLQIATLKAK
jgi:sugar lactone lactonase YvrE